MNFLKCLVLVLVTFDFTAAGYIHHDHKHVNSGVIVHYSVVTEHKADHSDNASSYKDDSNNSFHTSTNAGGYNGDHNCDHDARYNGNYGGGHDISNDFAYLKYDFSYGIKYYKTGDINSKSKSRDNNGNVKCGRKADLTTHQIIYTAAKHEGFSTISHVGNHGNHTTGHEHKNHDHSNGQSHSHDLASSFIIKKQEEKKD